MKPKNSPHVAQPEDKYVVRFPDGMREMLKQAAAQNNRSMNAEIVARLEQSFSVDNDPAILRLLARLEMQLAESEMLSSMSDIQAFHLVGLFEDAVAHIKAGTEPSKDELKEWQSELSDLKDFSFDELEEKLKATANRLADAREKLGLPPHRHKFGVYNK